MIVDKLTNEVGKLAPVEKMYDDIAHPAFSHVGQAAGSLLRFICLPFTFLGMTAEQLSSKYEVFIKKSISIIPEEKRVEIPSGAVVANILDKAKFAFEEDAICKLFENLLASSIDIERIGMLHPSFTDVVTNMSSFDAALLKKLFRLVKADGEGYNQTAWYYGSSDVGERTLIGYIYLSTFTVGITTPYDNGAPNSAPAYSSFRLCTLVDGDEYLKNPHSCVALSVSIAFLEKMGIVEKVASYNNTFVTKSTDELRCKAYAYMNDADLDSYYKEFCKAIEAEQTQGWNVCQQHEKNKIIWNLIGNGMAISWIDSISIERIKMRFTDYGYNLCKCLRL